MTLNDHKDKFQIGTKFNYLGFYANGKPEPSGMFGNNSSRWEVERIVECGLVVSHPSNKGHQHLLEWNKELADIEFA